MLKVTATETPHHGDGFLALILILAGAAACALYLFAEIYLLGGGVGFPLDDSWIHLQFAKQLAAGHGLAYNSDRWMPGSTAPLWTALLALGFLVPNAAVWWSKTLGIVCFLAAVVASDRLGSELGLGKGLRLLSGLLIVATHWLVWSALSGMEICLFAALSLWGLVLHLRERRRGYRDLAVSLPVLALAALARPEGYLLLLLAGVDRLLAPGRRADWRPLVEGLVLALVVVAPTLAFYRLTGGSFLPTTFAVKASAPGDLLPNGRYLAAVLNVLFGAQPVMLLLAGAGAVRLAERLGSERDQGLLPVAWIFGLPLAYSLLGSDRGPILVGNFGRYLFPLIPLLVVLGVFGLEPLARRCRGWRLRILLVTLLLLPQLWSVVRGAARYAQTIANVEDSDVRAARWLAKVVPAQALIAAQDIGATKFFLPNRVLDLTGIVNPEILPFLKVSGSGSSWEANLYSFLEQEQPDYLVVFPSSYPQLTRQSGLFSPVASFPIANNVTMAGDELVVYATKWNRFPLASDAGGHVPGP